MTRILIATSSWIRFAAPVLASLFLVIVPGLALADIIALRSGESVEGVVSNREQVAANPELFRVVAILPNGETEVRRFDVADIKYVLLIDGDAKRVVDFGRTSEPLGTTSTVEAPAAESNPSRTIYSPRDPGAKKKRQRGIAVMLAGAIAVGVGALYKLGPPETEITEDGVRTKESTYNTGNYVLMVGGAVVFAAGVVLYKTAGTSSPGMYGYGPSEIGVGWVIAKF